MIVFGLDLSYVGLWTCLIVGGCSVNVSHSETQYACETSDLCPAGVECVNGLCIIPCSETSCATGEACIDRECIVSCPETSCAMGEACIDRECVSAGEILNYSFDEPLDNRLIHDRSGNRLDGEIDTETSIPGRFGMAAEFEEGSSGIVLPLSPLLFSEDTITIEALVRPADLNRDRVIYGNHELLEGVDYSFGITEDNTLEFITSDGCSLTVSYQSTSRVGTGEWQHAAVTWDGDMVRFYLDGVEGGVFASDVTPCAFQGKYHVGIRADGTGRFVGGIDEVKVSGYAKSPAQIVQSMEHDSRLDIGLCGDKLLEGESCLANELCCTNTCEVAVDSVCGDGICSASGACSLAGGRVADGLLVLYEFSENGGETVFDTSGVTPAIDLTIGEISGVVWNAGSLEVIEPANIFSTADTGRIVSSVAATDEFSVEAWVSTANVEQGGPARIVTMSGDTTSRNFTLGQERDVYVGRIVSTVTDRDGNPVIDTPLGDIVVNLKQHVVMTRSADGTKRLFIDGVLRSATVVGGVLRWEDYPIAVGGEVGAGGARLWKGEFYLAAIYGRALTAIEVARNYSAGSE